MKQFFEGFLIGFIILCVSFFICGVTTCVIKSIKAKIPESPTEEVITEERSPIILTESYQLTDWDLLILAIIETESEFNFLAEGTKNDVGIFQITPVYVEDVNRIVGVERYSHSDAYDPEKSLEMFNIIQTHYNPGKDIKKAIHLHNPIAGSWYERKVMTNLEYIKNYERIRMNLESHR